MTTEAQIIANRRNSQKSTGPRSPEGKAIVSKNAVKHGLFASENVIKGENREDFDLFHDKMLSEMDPVGAMESFLAERVISLSWRLNRVGRMQNQAIDVMIERDGPSPLTRQIKSMLPKHLRDVQDDPRGSGPELILGRAVIKDYTNSRVLDRLFMYERRIENSMLKIMNELRRLRLIRKQEEANAGVNQKSRCKMQNHNVKFKNSAYRLIRPESAESPGEPEEVNLKKQSQSAPAQIGAKSYVGENYENKSRPGLQKNKVNSKPISRSYSEEANVIVFLAFPKNDSIFASSSLQPEYNWTAHYLQTRQKVHSINSAATDIQILSSPSLLP